MKYFCSLLLFSATLGAQVQPVIYDTIALNIPQSKDVYATNNSIENVINISKTFMGQSKLTSIDVNDNYKPKYEGEIGRKGHGSEVISVGMNIIGILL